jgi:cell volume regulation protein A
MTGPEPFVAAAALLVLFGVLASKVSSRLGIPALLLFLGVGMLAGSEGIGGIEFADAELAQTVGVLALGYILFAGGLSTQWREVRPIIGPAVSLATFGVAITAVIAGSVAAWVLDLPWQTGLLLGAILSSTDAAAVFSVLRSRQVSLRGQVRPLLELESGSNDPMAVFLTVGLLELITRPDASVLSLVPLFVLQAVVGAVVGLVLAKLTILLIGWLRLDHDGLYPVVTLAAVVLIYSSAAALGGSGFLAVYLAGLVMGSSEFLHKKSLIRFHDAIAWLAQISMFLVLGLLVFPSQLWSSAGSALLVALVLVVVARPVAVFATLALSRFGVRELTMVSWVGLRGAVPIILATFPLVEGVPGAALIFNVVFFAVLVSVLVQGTTIPVVARWLGVEAPLSTAPPYPLEAVSTGHEGAALHELVVAEGSSADRAQVFDLGLPEGSLIVMISRDDAFVVPQGSTRLVAQDKVLVLADDEALSTIRSRIEGPPPA